MGADKSLLHGQDLVNMERAAPSFVYVALKLLIALGFVGASWYAVTKGLQFFDAAKQMLVKEVVAQEIGAFDFTLGDKQINGLGEKSKEELAGILYLVASENVSCKMALATIQDTAKEAFPQ